MTPKAAHYIEQLDQARCEGNWSAVPELVRKVRKHAPQRACLTLTAETECAISMATGTAATSATTSAPSSDDRPNAAAAAAAKSLDASSTLPKLLSAIEAEAEFPEDRFQGLVCVGWLHWVVAEYSLALARLPKSLDQLETPLDPVDTTSEWTVVCALKSAYLRANALTRNYARADALGAFQSGLPSLARVWAGKGSESQLRYWSEMFLTEFCMLASQSIQDSESSLEEANSISCFRTWGKFWTTISSTFVGGSGFKGSVPRRRIWNEYYIALSRILEDDLQYPTGLLDNIANESSARSQLRAELKSAETAYHTLLIAETTFPRADDERAEVEAFVHLAVKNWSILCGRGWRERDLGSGGRATLSRGVLNILFQAATKTYHSTAILRSLFVVHLSLAEFDLAFAAFDSYLDLVKKGKARMDKTGHTEPSLDDDGTVLETIAQATIALCQYGHRKAAEKARALGAELEDWLAKLPPVRPTDSGTPIIAEAEERSDLHPPVSPQTLALAWQAIGLSHAQWSRMTYEAGSRTEVQSRAVRCLRRSLASEFGRSKDIRGFFALALLLAERRELTAAIDVVRNALLVSSGQEGAYHLQHGAYWQERSLIPMWHLLALLLSARQDYVAAARACEGALEQFKEPSVLFGKADPSFRSEHLKDAGSNAASSDSTRGLVDEMSDEERESILEVKMTQLALIELLEGPDVAVNASYELLTLFSRLFGSVTAQPMLNAPVAAQPPKTSGTLRSIRGSIFGNKTDRSRPSTRQPSAAVARATPATIPERPATSTTSTSGAPGPGPGAPSIQVTEEGTTTQGGRAASINTQRSSSKRRNSLKKRERSSSRRRPSTSSAVDGHTGTVVEGEAFFTPAVEGDQSDFFVFASKKQLHKVSSFSRGKTLPSLGSYLSSNSKSSDYSELTAETTYATTSLLPLVQFSKDVDKLQKASILIKLWLMIAGFYRRADMYEEAVSAIGEAQKLVQGLEGSAASDPSAGMGAKGPSWGEKQSTEELWGDVFSEMGLLSLSRDAPFVAREEFESALTQCPDHPAATIGLCNILLDIYTEDLLPAPTIPPLDGLSPLPSSSLSASKKLACKLALPSTPIGLGPSRDARSSSTITPGAETDDASTPPPNTDNKTVSVSTPPDEALLPPYKAASLPLIDRLAARDRAFALLSGLTRLGAGWNRADVWFALARAHEESGQPDKAKEVLWWCIELEEATGVRDWRCLGSGGYTI